MATVKYFAPTLRSSSKRILLLVALLFSPVASLPQKEGKAWCDSMLAVLPGLKEDTFKVRFINKLCWEYAEYDAPSALKLNLAGLHLAEKLGDKYGQGLSHVGIGGIYDLMTKGPDATDHYLKAQPILEEIGEYTLLCTDYLFLGMAFSNVDSAMTAAYFQKAKALLPLNRDPQWKERNLGLMSNLFRWQGKYDSAMHYVALSRKMCETHGFNWDRHLMITFGGYLYLDTGQLDSAFILLDSALSYFTRIENTRLPGEILVTLSEVRMKQSRQDSKNRNRYLREAEAYAQEAMEFGRKSRSVNTIGWSYKCLTDIYYDLGEYKKAIDHFIIGFAYYDSLLGPKTISKISNLSRKYENQLNEKQMELLKLRNRQQVIVIFSAVAGIIVLAVVVILVIRNRRRLKKALKLLGVQKKALELHKEEIEVQKEKIEQQKEEVECQKEELEQTLEQLKNTQSQLIQSEKMASLGLLTAGIAHEINNPVNFINSGVVSLQKDYEDLERLIRALGELPPDAKKIADEIGMEELLRIIPQTIGDIQTGVTRTSEIVKGLRNFTRMDTTELRETDIHEGIDSTILLLGHKIKDRIRVEKDYDQTIGLIKCYPGPLNQVFMNLLNNAIDAIDQQGKRETENRGNGGTGEQENRGTGKPGTGHREEKGALYAGVIRISTKRTEEGIRKQVRIVIEDNGSGIPEEIRDKIFDPFFTTKEVGKGTGLGLSICHGIIEKHGGSITFESRPGEGSSFVVTLPVAA